MKTKILLLTLFCSLISFGQERPTKFKDGIELPNATEKTKTGHYVAVVDSTNKQMNGYVPFSSIAPDLSSYYKKAEVDTLYDINKALLNGNEAKTAIYFPYNQTSTGYKLAVYPVASTTNKAGQFAVRVQSDGYVQVYSLLGDSSGALSNNLYYGTDALRNFTKDSVNIFYPPHNHDHGKNNTAFGHSAMKYLTGGYGNTAVGTNALRNSQWGDDNTVVGEGAATFSTRTSESTIFGATAGLNSTYLKRAILIGRSAAQETDSIQSSTIIGNYIYDTDKSENEIIISDGTSSASGVGIWVTKAGLTTLPRQTLSAYNSSTTGFEAVTRAVLENSLLNTATLDDGILTNTQLPFFWDKLNERYLIGSRDGDVMDDKAVVEIVNSQNWDQGEGVLVITTAREYNDGNKDFNNKSELRLSRAGGTISDPEPIKDNFGIGEVDFSGYRGDRYYNAARIESQARGDWSLTSTPTILGFRTVQSGTTSTNGRMIIDHNGNIGIGTGAGVGYNSYYLPLYKLDVDGTIRATGNVITSDATASNHSVALGQLLGAAGQFVVTNTIGDGLEKRGIIGSDLGLTGDSFQVPYWNGGWQSHQVVQAGTTGNSIACRTAGGQIKMSDATTSNEGATLGQIVGTAGQLPFTNSAGTGIEKRTIVGSDFGTASNIRVYFWNNSTQSWGNYQPSQGGATGGSLPIRTSDGTIKVANALSGDDAAAWNQVESGLAIAYQNGRRIYTGQSSFTIPTGSSRTTLNLNIAVDDDVFNNSNNWSFTWRETRSSNPAFVNLASVGDCNCWLENPTTSVVDLVCENAKGSSVSVANGYKLRFEY